MKGGEERESTLERMGEGERRDEMRGRV